MVSAKTQLQLVQDEGQSHVMLDLDFKVRILCVHLVYSLLMLFDCPSPSRCCWKMQGKDWNSQAKVGNGGFYGMLLCMCIQACVGCMQARQPVFCAFC